MSSDTTSPAAWHTGELNVGASEISAALSQRAPSLSLVLVVYAKYAQQKDNGGKRNIDMRTKAPGGKFESDVPSAGATHSKAYGTRNQNRYLAHLMKHGMHWSLPTQRMIVNSHETPIRMDKKGVIIGIGS